MKPSRETIRNVRSIIAVALVAAVEAFQPFTADEIKNAMTYYIGFGTGPYGASHRKNIVGLQRSTPTPQSSPG